MATGAAVDGPAMEDLAVYDVRVDGEAVFVAPRD
jgi:nitrite reductase/ring-hydroxylating ferredoxin subunit